jgi:chromosome segregation ATPase
MGPRWILGILVLSCSAFLSASTLIGQAANETDASTGNSIRILSDQRTRLGDDIEGLRRRIDQLDLTMKQIDDAKKNLEYWKGEGRKENPATAPEEIKGWTGTLSGYHEDTVQKELNDSRQALAGKQHELDEVEKKIYAMIDIERPKQEFKKQLSWVFAGLVALV